MNPRLLATLIAALSTLPLAAQDKPAAPPAAKPLEKIEATTPPIEVAAAGESALTDAVAKTQQAFLEAFNKADAAAVASFYDEAATYTSDSGKYMDGRAAIEAGMKEYFKLNPGARLEVQTQSVREVTPDVLVASGMAVFSGTAGATEVTRYKAIHARRGESWKIVELTENVLPAEDRGQVELAALDWMTGAWRDKAEGDQVQTRVAWTKSGKFLRRSISVMRSDEEVLQATEIIGWDPARAQIRSWVFDSEGGFGEGVWTQEGRRWVVKMTSTLPNGQKASALNIFTQKDADTYTWESTSREVGGEVQASIEKVEVVRDAASVAPEPPPGTTPVAEPPAPVQPQAR
jgi:uncharacterized protein (TIGR02246 family)